MLTASVEYRRRMVSGCRLSAMGDLRPAHRGPRRSSATPWARGARTAGGNAAIVVPGRQPLVPARPLVTEELLDFRDEVVTGRQPFLIDHRLEPFHIAAGVLVDRRCRVEPTSELNRLLVQRAA